MLNKELKVFEHSDFGELRVFEEDGEFLFVGKDVAMALGYVDLTQALRKNCKNPKYLKSFKSVSGTTLNLHQNLLIITEPDVYRLIFKSQLPSAEKFQDWVMEEVLPSIRKHGLYATDDFVETALTDPDKMIQILTNYKFEKQRRKLAEQQREEAIKTKAWISDKKTATAMATASVYSRQNDNLKVQIGDSKKYKQVKAIPWLKDVFDTKQKAMYSQVGRQLTKICKKFDYDYRAIEDSVYGSVKAYHVDAIEHLRHKIIEDDLLLRKYRKDF